MAKKTDNKAPVVKTIEELQAELTTKRIDLLEAKRGNAAGELTNPRVVTHTRKEIARLMTAIKLIEIKDPVIRQSEEEK